MLVSIQPRPIIQRLSKSIAQCGKEVSYCLIYQNNSVKAAAYTQCVSAKALDVQKKECEETYRPFANCMKAALKKTK